MYEEYSRQALPSKKYRELLGSALCVFVSNNAFVIENILRCNQNLSWFDLINEESGKLMPVIKDTITKKSNTKIARCFDKIISIRNRIVHSFQCTDDDNEQILVTKDKHDNQITITEEFLLDFIKENEKLSDMLHDFREFDSLR